MGSRIRFLALKRGSFLSWAIIISLLVFGAYFIYGSLRIKQAQIDAKDYSSAPFCELDGNCRTVVQARVLQSQTLDVSTFVTTGKYSLGYKKINDKRAYLVILQPKDHEKYKAVVLPDIEIDANLFDVPNVYFPDHYPNGPFDRFAERSFPTGAILNVEVWKDRPTFIYSKYVNSSYSINTLTFSNPFLPSATKTSENSETATTYAIPTTDNPLIAYELMQDKFDQSLTMVALFPIFFVILKAFTVKW